MRDVVVPSPAKINLYLEVLRRRPDGYHEIETVMQLVDLCDTVRIAPGERGIHLSVSGAELPEGSGNLAYRAAELLLKSAGVDVGLEIHLEKRIPVAAGLGGGSSNAAAVLAGVNHLLGLKWSKAALTELGAALGSDVPFFFSDGLALATGRGEKLASLEPWAPQWLVLGNPGVAVSTAWAYHEASSKLTEWQGRDTIQSSIRHGRLPWPPRWAFNRLEEVVLPHRPEIQALKLLLQQGGGNPVLMSGSGASVFAVVPKRSAADALVDRVHRGGAFAAAVMTLTRNPILTATA